MKKIALFAAAMGAALAFAAPASAKGWKHHGHGWERGHHARYYVPMRSNRGGYLRGHARARYVHRLNRERRWGH